jgi:type 1 fimbria pilin
VILEQYTITELSTTTTVLVLIAALVTMVMLSPILANLDDAAARRQGQSHQSHGNQVIKQTCQIESGSCNNVKVQTSGSGNTVTINGVKYR